MRVNRFNSNQSIDKISMKAASIEGSVAGGHGHRRRFGAMLRDDAGNGMNCRDARPSLRRVPSSPAERPNVDEARAGATGWSWGIQYIDHVYPGSLTSRPRHRRGRPTRLETDPGRSGSLASSGSRTHSSRLSSPGDAAGPRGQTDQKRGNWTLEPDGILRGSPAPARAECATHPRTLLLKPS